MPAQLHVRRGDKVLGPFSPRKIKQMIADDKITPCDLIRVEGGDQWNTIGDVPNLAKYFRAKRTPKPVPRPSGNAATRKTNRSPQRTQVPAKDARRGDCGSPLNIHAALNSRCPSCGERVNEGYARCRSCSQPEIVWVSSTIAYAAENTNLEKQKGAFHVGPCLLGEESAVVVVLDKTVRDFNSTHFRRRIKHLLLSLLCVMLILPLLVMADAELSVIDFWTKKKWASGPRSSNSPRYNSDLERNWQNNPAFQNADPKVQEDVMIYKMLRQEGYSHQKSMNSVIKSMNK